MWITGNTSCGQHFCCRCATLSVAYMQHILLPITNNNVWIWLKFYDQYVKWRRFAQGCAFWGFRKQKFIFRPHFPPKTENFSQFLTGLRNFPLKKALTMGMLTYKLLLIVIVDPWKLANPNMGLPTTYYLGIVRGHMTQMWNFGTPSVSRER